MITRAQAEALLTLAESLEACERLGMAIQFSELFTDICMPQDNRVSRVPNGSPFRSMDIRVVLNNIYPRVERNT